MDLFTLTILFVSGIVTGIYGSVVGGGGLLITATFSLLGAPIVQAVATMHTSAVFLEGTSGLIYWRKGLIEWKPALKLGFLSAIGGLVGANIVIDFDPHLLSYIVAGFMVALLFLVPFLRSDNRALRFSNPRVNNWLFLLVGLLLGLYGGFYGAAFGTLAIFFLATHSGLGLLRSSASARIAGFILTLVSSTVFIVRGTINWELFVPMTLGVIIGSVVGVNWATKFGSRWIKILLTMVIIASVIRLILYPG